MTAMAGAGAIARETAGSIALNTIKELASNPKEILNVISIFTGHALDGLSEGGVKVAAKLASNLLTRFRERDLSESHEDNFESAFEFAENALRELCRELSDDEKKELGIENMSFQGESLRTNRTDKLYIRANYLTPGSDRQALERSECLPMAVLPAQTLKESGILSHQINSTVGEYTDRVDDKEFRPITLEELITKGHEKSTLNLAARINPEHVKVRTILVGVPHLKKLKGKEDPVAIQIMPQVTVGERTGFIKIWGDQIQFNQSKVEAGKTQILAHTLRNGATESQCREYNYAYESPEAKAQGQSPNAMPKEHPNRMIIMSIPSYPERSTRGGDDYALEATLSSRDVSLPAAELTTGEFRREFDAENPGSPIIHDDNDLAPTNTKGVVFYNLVFVDMDPEKLEKIAELDKDGKSKSSKAEVSPEVDAFQDLARVARAFRDFEHAGLVDEYVQQAEFTEMLRKLRTLMDSGAGLASEIARDFLNHDLMSYVLEFADGNANYVPDFNQDIGSDGAFYHCAKLAIDRWNEQADTNDKVQLEEE